MSADVLAVMDRLIARSHGLETDVLEARAAMEQMIYAVAVLLRYDIHDGSDDSYWLDVAQLRSALARVQGGAA